METEKETEELEKTATAEDNVEDPAAEGVQDEGSVPLQEAGLEEELQKAKDEGAELRDKMLRVAAEFENYKKRTKDEHAKLMKYAGEHIFREMLSVVDNLERALNHGSAEDDADAEKKLEGLIQGIELTLKSLVGSLEKFEVKSFDSVGEPFDPTKQEAMIMEASNEIPENHVVTEYEKGYFFKDRLLRAAKVVVSSGKPA